MNPGELGENGGQREVRREDDGIRLTGERSNCSLLRDSLQSNTAAELLRMTLESATEAKSRLEVNMVSGGGRAATFEVILLPSPRPARPRTPHLMDTDTLQPVALPTLESLPPPSQLAYSSVCPPPLTVPLLTPRSPGSTHSRPTPPHTTLLLSSSTRPPISRVDGRELRAEAQVGVLPRPLAAQLGTGRTAEGPRWRLREAWEAKGGRYPT